jgi:nitroreductase
VIAQDLILGRRTVRVYSPGEVSPETVQRLLDAAMAAPSAMGKDPWRFVIARNPETMRQLARILPGGQMLPGANAAIVVAGDLEAAFDRQVGYLIQDCSAAIQNLLLSAHGQGLGACWVGIYPQEPAMAKVRELFGFPGSFVPVAAIALGQPGEQLPSRTRFNPASVRAEKWQACRPGAV